MNCQKFLLIEQHKKDGFVQPVAQGKPKTDAKKNGKKNGKTSQKKTRYESNSKYPGKKH